MGDTGVAVNPNDERYKHLIGKTCILPIMNREIPIFGDEYVDMEFGTGCVKVTPCHDPNDFEMGQRHNLEQILVFNEDANRQRKRRQVRGHGPLRVPQGGCKGPRGGRLPRQDRGPRAQRRHLLPLRHDR